MFGILQQEQNRKNQASQADAAHKNKKTEGLLGMLKGGNKKSESIQEKHKRIHG